MRKAGSPPSLAHFVCSGTPLPGGNACGPAKPVPRHFPNNTVEMA